MKTEREIYLKPLTLREQVAMEQGICAGSMVFGQSVNPVKAEAHYTGFDTANGNTFSVDGVTEENSGTGLGGWN